MIGPAPYLRVQWPKDACHQDEAVCQNYDISSLIGAVNEAVMQKRKATTPQRMTAGRLFEACIHGDNGGQTGLGSEARGRGWGRLDMHIISSSPLKKYPSTSTIFAALVYYSPSILSYSTSYHLSILLPSLANLQSKAVTMDWSSRWWCLACNINVSVTYNKYVYGLCLFS